MRKFTFLKMMLLAVVMLAGSGMTWGTTVNYSMSSLGLTNGTVTGTDSYTVDAVISISFAKNDASTAPTYYSADGVRLYQNATKGGSMKISVANGYKITDVVVTRAGTAGDGPAGYSIDNTTEAGTFEDNTVTNSINSINATSYVEYYSKGTTSTTRTYIASIAVTYTSGSSTPTVATPAFSPGTGNYLTTQNVTITTATEGATIRYTANGAEPTESSTEYTAPIAVSSTTTLIAKAFKAGMDPSAVATATYSFPSQVADIAGFLASTETGNLIITGAVTVVYQNGSNLYVKDASGSLLVYGSTGKTFVNGDQLTGLMGIRGVYGQSPQMTNPVAPDAVTGTVVNPTALDLAAVSTSDHAKYVKVENVQFTADVTFSTTSTVNGTLVAPTGFTVRDNFRLGGAFTAVKSYDIIGFVNYYNGTAQLYPVTITELVTTSPIIIATPTTISLSAEIGDPDVSQDITVTGENLTSEITATISGTDAGQFSVSVATLPQAGGTLTVTYSPSATAAVHTATLTLSSTNATDVVITLNGETKEQLALSGDGSSTNPYTVSDVFLLNNSETTSWVVGYIVGVPSGGSNGFLTTVDIESPFTGATAIALAETSGETDLTKMIPVQLPSGSVRTALNLVDNLTILGKQVKVYGDLLAYFYAPGVKNTSDYVLDPSTGLTSTRTDAQARAYNGKVLFNATAGESVEIYNTLGQRLYNAAATDGQNEVPVAVKGVAIVKVGNRVGKVIL